MALNSVEKKCNFLISPYIGVHKEARHKDFCDTLTVFASFLGVQLDIGSERSPN
jgi:hypothetical protein